MTSIFTPSPYVAAALAALPVLRKTGQAEDLILRIEPAGLTVVTLHPKQGGGWMTMLVNGVHRGVLPGMKLRVDDETICSATAVDGKPAALAAAAKRALAAVCDPGTLMNNATEFTFTPPGAAPDADDLSAFTVKVEYRSHGRWAVTNAGRCWGPEGWEHEPSPSNRSTRYLAAHRFALDHAAAIAAVLAGNVSVNGRTWSQWQEVFQARRAAARNEVLAG